MDIYNLSRNWFNYCFENPEKISPNHSALFFFIIEHCNRLGWKEKFGLPSEMAKEAIGIKNYRTYQKTLNDLIEFGFIKLIQISKNQYSSNVIAIVKNAKATTKALDKAMQKHTTKQGESIVSIDIQLYNNTNLQYKDVWDIWVKYKKDQFKFSYKNIESEILALNDLIKKSNNNTTVALELVENAIIKGYKGIYPIGNDSKKNNSIASHIKPTSDPNIFHSSL